MNLVTLYTKLFVEVTTDGVPDDGSPSDMRATQGLFSLICFQVGASLTVVAGDRLVIL